MQTQISEEKLIELFVVVDEFTSLFDLWLASRALTPTRKPTRQTKLSTREIITLLVYYHHSGYKNVQYYYQRLVEPQMRTLLSPTRYLSTIYRFVAPPGGDPACADQIRVPAG